MCHEPSGSAMREADRGRQGDGNAARLRAGRCDICVRPESGHQPSAACSVSCARANKRGARIVSFNPMRETWPSSDSPIPKASSRWRRWGPLPSAHITSSRRGGGDLAVVKGMMKAPAGAAGTRASRCSIANSLPCTPRASKSLAADVRAQVVDADSGGVGSLPRADPHRSGCLLAQPNR